MQESWVGKFGTSVVSMNECIQRDPVAALPALYLLFTFHLSLNREECIHRHPVAALPALYLSTHFEGFN
jgi:hypothetical protein